MYKCTYSKKEKKEKENEKRVVYLYDTFTFTG